MRKKTLFIFSFYLISLSSIAQLDSLLELSSKQSKQEDYKGQTTTEYEIAKYYYNDYEDSLALYHFKKCIQIAKKVNDKRRLILANNSIGNIISEKGKHQGAIKYYQKAIEYSEGNDTLKASVMNNLGLELKSIGKYKEAVETLYSALKLKEKIKASPKSISATLLNIGLIWDVLEDYDKALIYYHRSLKLKRELKDSLGISKVLSNIGVIYKNKGELNKAIQIIEQSNTFNATSQDIEQYYVNHVNLGNIHKKLNHSDLFLSHFEQAYKFAQELENPEKLSDIHQNLGTYHFEQKNYDKAIFHLEKAIEIPGETITLVLKYEIHESLSTAYAAKGIYNKAYTHLLKSNGFRDSLFKIENQRAMHEIREQYETEKKEKELAQKNLKLAKSEINSRRKSMIIYLLSGGGIILGLIVFIAFRNYREKQRRKIIQSEQKLQSYREEIELLRSGIQAHLEENPGKLNVKITQEDINQYLIDPLSEREREVLEQISAGKTNREIATTIFVSENTVKFHLKNIYLKLDVKNRTEAITKADALNVWNTI